MVPSGCLPYIHHLVRAEAVKTAGDLVLGRALTPGMEEQHTLEAVRFELVGGVWVPMACRTEYRELFPERSPQPTTWTVEHKILTIQLNPAFHAPPLPPRRYPGGGAGLPVGHGGEQHPDYLWRNGKQEPWVE